MADSVLLRALRDPSFVLRPQAEDHAAAMVRAQVLSTVARALSDAGVPALLVKGAALAITVYATPAARPMKDVDLLIRPADRQRATAALASAGASVHRAADRPLTAGFIDEIAFIFHAGAMPQLVEAHTSLDKIVSRPLDHDALFARAISAPGLPGLLIPSPEDHALLVAQHAAGHELRHPIALLDLELLFRHGLDLDLLVRRSREARLSTAMYVALAALRRLGAASITADHVAAFDPGPVLRALADRLHGHGALAGAAGEDHLGLGWILRQAALRDDLGAFALGVGRYAAARARERLGDGHERRASGAQPGRTTTVSEAAMAGESESGQDAAVDYRLPLWVKAFLAVDRASVRVDSLREGLRDELFLAWIRPEDRAALTASVYEHQKTYFPGGYRFQSGLFSWEKKVLDSSLFPKGGRVLLGAAGAGRELVALLDRGFEVVAFDPCAPFADTARRVAASPRATVLHASYEDLVTASQGRPSPLSAALAGAPFDAVILGWGSLSHVLPGSERASLLRAVRAVAPQAPVLASFGLEPDIGAGGKGRVRDTLRRLFSALKAPGISEANDHFFPHGGFFAYLGADEIVRLAWGAGYEVALFEESPYAHAVLVPLTGEQRGAPRS